MSDCTLDHLVVTAPTLEAGAAWVEARLGVRPGPGGTHDRMGTHNLLLSLGPSAYLEVIAVNPAAPHPGRPRWFGLDELSATAESRLAAWVYRTTDLEAIDPKPGPIETMTRGSLTWRITVPPDGRLPFDGAGPLFIQWQTDRPPSMTLPDAGCVLHRLDVIHPEAGRILAGLAANGFRGPVLFAEGAPGLAATIRVPHGVRDIS
jgi:hypothetical protein